MSNRPKTHPSPKLKAAIHVHASPPLPHNTISLRRPAPSFFRLSAGKAHSVYVDGARRIKMAGELSCPRPLCPSHMCTRLGTCGNRGRVSFSRFACCLRGKRESRFNVSRVQTVNWSHLRDAFLYLEACTCDYLLGTYSLGT